ncbi:hypothetical protein, partial [Klebsiella aerogenes]
ILGSSIALAMGSGTWGRGLFTTFSLICYTIGMLLLADATLPSILILAAFVEGTGAGILILE